MTIVTFENQGVAAGDVDPALTFPLSYLDASISGVFSGAAVVADDDAPGDLAVTGASIAFDGDALAGGTIRLKIKNLAYEGQARIETVETDFSGAVSTNTYVISSVGDTDYVWRGVNAFLPADQFTLIIDDHLNGAGGAPVVIDDIVVEHVTAEVDGETHLINTGSEEDDLLDVRSDGVLSAQPSYMAGYGGDDRLYGDNCIDLPAFSDGWIISGGDGDDVITGAQTGYGDAGEDRVTGCGRRADTLFGGDDNDSVFGLGRDDMIYGGQGSDFLQGGQGDDVVYGGKGFDKLQGSAGDDMLTGGAGNDTFQLKAGWGVDTITDWGDGADKLRIFGFDFDDVTISATGDDARVDVGDAAFVLLDVDAADLAETDFIFT